MIDDAATVWIRRPHPGPLLVVLHGYGASQHDLVPLLPHLGHRASAAFLQAPIPLGPGARAWFPLQISPGNTDLGAEGAEVATAASHVRTWLDEHAEGQEVVLLGFSQGGATALEVARTRPDGIIAVVVLSGFVVGTHPGPGDLPIFFGHGSADRVIPPELTAQTSAWLASNPRVTERSYPGLPHAVDGRELADVAAFLADLD